MESLPSIINSFLYGEKMEVGCPQISYLQMLHATTQYEVENGEYSQCLEKERNEVDVSLIKERRRKKKRAWVSQTVTVKGRKEAERQRMNHIAVERNRRKLMNSRLSVLHSLLPSSLVQRNDQASIVAGAIDYIKSLEQLLISLQAKKKQHLKNNQYNNLTTSSTSSCTVNNKDFTKATSTPILDFVISPQHASYTESKCGIDVEATVVQGHVNLKIVGKRNQRQLVRAIGTLEQFRLTVMHLNITSLDASSVLYSLNLKVEEDCKTKSADEIARLVHQIFNTCCVD